MRRIILFATMIVVSGCTSKLIKEKIKEMDAAEKATMNAYFQCVMYTTQKYSGQKEDAETIADAAIGNCSNEYSHFEETVIKYVQAGTSDDGQMTALNNARIMASEIRSDFRKKAINLVLKIRSP